MMAAPTVFDPLEELTARVPPDNPTLVWIEVAEKGMYTGHPDR